MNHNLWKTFWRAYPLIYKPVWRENLLLSFVDIFHGMSFAVLVILTQRFFDSISACVGGTGSRNTVILTAAILITCQVISQLLNGFVNFYADVVREKGYGRICVMIQKKISKMRPVDFERNSFLTDINMADEGAKEACAMVDTANSILTFYVPYFALMGIYMYRLDFRLIVTVFLIFLPVLLTNCVKMYFGDRIERQIAPVRREAEAYEQTLTTLDCYRETRVLGATRYFLRLYREGIQKWNKTTWRNRRKEAVINLLLHSFSFLAYGVILLILVSGCVRGQITVGAFAAVFSSIDVMFLLMEEVFQDSLGELTQNIGRVNNFLNLMDSPENMQESVEIDNGKIVLDDVSFRYPEAAEKCLDHISLAIQNGETIAVVGENGAGKTTLARIILGIFKPDSGRVIVGGQVMDENRNCFSSISAVFQKFNRYKLNLEDNVRISDLDSMEDYKKALQEVDREMNMDSQVILSRDFDGIDLSGGQWQKIAIARGIYKKSRILLLDEPTSAIDPLQESRLYQTFLHLAEGKTCIVITHRLGLARIADRIVVLKDGKIAENGSHQQLLEQRGEYARMWEAQAGWYIS